MSAIFTPHLYSFLPGRGFGVTPRASYAYLPEPCGTYQPLDIDAPDPERPYRPRPSATVIRLGPGVSGDAWINKEKPGALVVMQDGDTSNAAHYGFATLNLWHLVGYARGTCFRNPVPPIEIGALQVGLALADAWEKNPRVAVEGPAWALDLLQALPGAIVCARSHDRSLYITAWGRRWHVSPGSTDKCPFEIAARLSGPSGLAHDGSYHNVGSMLFWPSSGERQRVRVVSTGRDQWRVPTDLGVLTIPLDAQLHNVRWPCANDPWLVERVGDGEEVST